ncbi:MAG: hypothetical protein LUI02_02040 [Clostridiales bacterium]|nr:hypothetical protein [Clostridiales bacterium]
MKKIRDLRTKKLAIALALCVMTTSVFTSCGTGEKTSDNDSDEIWFYDASTALNFGEGGAFYYDNYIHFLDPSSATDSIICDRAECEHSKDDCPAYIDGMTYGIGWYDDSLLFLTTLGAGQLGDLYLYESSTNGENRKQIAYFSNIQSVLGCIFTDDYVIFSYYNQYDESLADSTEEAGIILYDRNSGDEREIFHIDGWNARIVQMRLIGDGLCFSVIYYDTTYEDVAEHDLDYDYLQQFFRDEIYLMSDMDQDAKKVCDDAGDIVAACDGKIFFVSDDMYRYDVESGEVERMSDWPVTSGTLSFLDDEMIFSRYDSDSGMRDYYECSAGSDELSEIGLTDMTILAVFENNTYAIIYSDDFTDNTYGYMPTEDFLAGNFDSFVAFEE